MVFAKKSAYTREYRVSLDIHSTFKYGRKAKYLYSRLSKFCDESDPLFK